TYGHGVYQFFLNDQKANSGALRAVAGSDVWTGSISLAGNTYVSANGTQALQSNTPAAQLTVIGTISDLTTGASPQLTKLGAGDVVFTGANTYGGITEVQEGHLVVHNTNALGTTGVTQTQTLSVGPVTNVTLTGGVTGVAITNQGAGYTS